MDSGDAGGTRQLPSMWSTVFIYSWLGRLELIIALFQFKFTSANWEDELLLIGYSVSPLLCVERFPKFSFEVHIQGTFKPDLLSGSKTFPEFGGSIKFS